MANEFVARKGLIVSGSTLLTGSLNILSGSITVAGGGNNSVTISSTGGSTIVNASNTQLFLQVNGDGVRYNGTDLSPQTTNTKDLGGVSNRWRNGYINNIVASGSITNTGSITLTTGATVALGSSVFGGTYINFANIRPLINLFTNGAGYDNAVNATGFSSADNWRFDGYSLGTKYYKIVSPTFRANTTTTGSGTAGLINAYFGGIFGSGSNFRWDSSEPMTSLYINPLFIVNAGSTGRGTALRINASSSIMSTNQVILLDAQYNSTSSFVVRPTSVEISGSLTVSGSGVTLQVSGSASVRDNFIVNGSTLVVDAGSNRVGINKLTPTTTLDVSGSAIITGSLIVSSSLPIQLQVIGVSEVSGSMNISGSLFTNTYSLVTRSLGNASGSMSINLNNANYFTAVASMSTTWTFDNPQSNRAVGFVLALASGGAVTQVWPSAVKWPGGSAPLLTPSGGIDVLTFITDNTGTAWRGVFSIVDSR